MAGSGLRTGSRSVGSHDVVLIEDAAPVRVHHGRGGSGGSMSHRLAIVAALALALALADLAQLREDRARTDALAEVAEILAPLRDPVTQRWSADVTLWPGAIAAADLLVGVETLGTGAFNLVAIDPDDGSVAWRALSGTDGRTTVQGCRESTPRAAGDIAGATATFDAVTIVCLVARPAAARLDNHQPLDVVLLDARTGEITEGEVTVSSDDLRDGPAPDQVDDGSLAGTTVLPTPEGGLIARDARSRSERWTIEPGRLHGPLAVLRSRVLAWAPDRVVGLDGRTGDVLWSLPARSDAATVLTDGRVVLALQDHPGPGAVLSAVDIESGYVEWTSDIPEDLHLFVLGGHLYGASPERLLALR